MRGLDERSGSLFSYGDLEARVRGDHPLPAIQKIANAALSELSRVFAERTPRSASASCYAGSLSPSGGAATSNALTTPHSIA
jgi:hypothetical protein